MPSTLRKCTVLCSVIKHFILLSRRTTSHVKGLAIQCMFNPENTHVYSFQTFNCHFQFLETDA